MIRLMKRSVGAASARWRSACAVLLVIAALPALNACSTQPPAGMTPVGPFQIERYLGKWYEIARLDHSFERGMSDVNATYQLQDDGSVKVINRGYDTRKQAWKEAIGRALFIGDSQTASLKVSFFGPFYGGYHVIALDEQNYRWSLVAGPDRGLHRPLPGQPVQGPGRVHDPGHRRVGQFGDVAGCHLVAQIANRLGRWPDPDQASVDHGLGEVGVLR